jgi:hypothetical protein
MQKGLVVARLEVGTCVYISQGPPISDQLLGQPDGYELRVWCPSEEVKKNARFASMQSKGAADDRESRDNPSELERLFAPRHGG